MIAGDGRDGRGSANFRLQAVGGVRPGSGLELGPVPAPNTPGWFHPGPLDSRAFTVTRKQAAQVYASSAKRIASTRPGTFLGTVFFFNRGLMMLIAEASSCVFKCAA